MKDKLDELALVWFKKARDDIHWVKHDFQGKFYGIVCFGCQQIVEKALKAYLFSRREKLVRTHNLINLLRKCSKHEVLFKKLISVCEILNNYYTDTRYPDIWNYDRFDSKKLASQAIKLAERVLEFVKKKINI